MASAMHTERDMMTISKEHLHKIIGGRGGHGEDLTPIDGCLFKAISRAGRQVDDELPAAKHSKAERDRRFLELRDVFATNCRNAKLAK